MVSHLSNPATKHDLDSLQYYLHNEFRRFVALFRTTVHVSRYLAELIRNFGRYMLLFRRKL